jgi:hypothetical protein
MLRFQLVITGNDELLARLRSASAKAPGVMDEISYRWAQNVRAKLKSTPYPPKRPGQRYVRTGRLANSWRAERLGKGRALIANSAGYSGYVVGKKQAWMHRGRWWLGRNVLMESAPELETAAKREIDRLLK